METKRKLCPHSRDKYYCKECKGGGICEHNRIRCRCTKCAGSQICKHGKRKQRCGRCKGIYICKHERQKDTCKQCGGLPTLAKMMYKTAKERAKRKNLPFRITWEEILVLIGDGVCPVFGTPHNLASRGVTDSSANLDRHISRLGYTKKNCRVICNLANRIKTNASIEQVEAVLNWMKAQRII